MNDKITFPRLASLLADRSGRSKRFSEDFLREFFALLSERLEAGESVKVKGLGTFRLARVEPRRSVDVTTGQPMEISGHSKVVFVPAKELAEAVNSPFEAFSAIEISDEADLGQIFPKDEIDLEDEMGEFSPDMDHEDFAYQQPTAVDEPEEIEPEETEPEALSDTEPEPEEETEPTTNYEPSVYHEPSVQPEPSPKHMAASHTDSQSQLEEASTTGKETSVSEEKTAEKTWEDTGKETPEEIAEETDEEFEEPRRRHRNWLRTIMISLGAALFALIATFAVWYVFATNDFKKSFDRTSANTNVQPAEGFSTGSLPDAGSLPDTVSATEPDEKTDEADETQEEPEAPTSPSDALVYDTVSTTRYLTTIAKAHYGNYNLWPYIYEENKAILGHPDRIKPGTPVVIPKLSKFGVDPSSKEDIERAKRLGTEIYARYGKKI